METVLSVKTFTASHWMLQETTTTNQYSNTNKLHRFSFWLL